MQGTVPVWKVGIVFACYVGIITLCTVFNEVQVRLPLTNYSMRPSKVWFVAELFCSVVESC